MLVKIFECVNIIKDCSKLQVELLLILEAQERVLLVIHQGVLQEVPNLKPQKDPVPIHRTIVKTITSTMAQVQEYVVKVIHLKAHQWPQHQQPQVRPRALQMHHQETLILNLKEETLLNMD